MQTVIEYALANAVAATALALLALLIGHCTRRPAVRHALWVLVLVRLVVPPVWTVPIAVPTFSADETPVTTSATTVDAFLITDVAPPRLSSDIVPVVAAIDWEPVIDQATEITTARPPVPEQLPESSLTPWAWVGGVWLVGTLFVVLRAVRQIRRFQRALRDSTPAPQTIQQQAAAIARSIGLRRCPQIVLVPGRVSPALWMPGVFTCHAKLIVPAGLLPLLDSGQRASVLAHELAHLRRGDPWVRWLELVVVALYWWFPLLAWFRSQLRAAEEECCDLWVVAALRERRDYATALVETAAFLGDSGPTAMLASGAGPVRHLQRRVTMIMRATWPAKLTRVGLAAVLGVGGLGLAFGPALAQDRGEEKKSNRGEERKAPPGKGDERPREPAKDRDERPGQGDRAERGNPETLEKARTEVERARKLAHEAMMQLRAAEEALAKLEGRPVARDPFDGRGDRGPGDRRPDAPMPPGGPGDPRGGPPPGAGRGGPGGDFRDLQQQVEELRRALEQMRQEMRGGRGGDRKDPDNSRGGPPRERPKDEPKRPTREPERQDF
jgi:beta-lactamase regulating signal transducer with metallopeptidase domain